jgi:hypothetical protein
MAFETRSSSAARLLLVLPDPHLARTAVRSGLDVWLVINEGRQAADFSVGADRLIRVQEGDREALHSAVIDAIARYDIAYTLNANGTPLGGRPSANGSQPDGASGSVHLLDDVQAVRLILSHSGLWHFDVHQPDTTSAATEAVRNLGFPAVIHSTEADVAVVRSVAELAEWRTAREAAGAGGPYLVEESLEGPRLVVTTLTVDGMHSVVGITAWLPGPLGPGYVYPATLAEADKGSVRAAARSLLDLAGYQFGPAQTSVVLTSRGPQVVRSRSRFGAYQIPRLIELAAGLDVRAELFRMLVGAPFRPPDPRWFAAIGFLPDSVRGRAAAPFAEPAQVLALPGVSELHVPTAAENLSGPGPVDTERAYVITEGVSLAAVAESMSAVRRMLD